MKYPIITARKIRSRSGALLLSIFFLQSDTILINATFSWLDSRYKPGRIAPVKLKGKILGLFSLLSFSSRRDRVVGADSMMMEMVVLKRWKKYPWNIGIFFSRVDLVILLRVIKMME